jgi:spore coat protein U-like protein
MNPGLPVPGPTRRRIRRRASVAGQRCCRAGLALVALLACAEAVAVVDCTASTTGVAFGTYDPLSAAPADSTGNVTIVCTYVSGGAAQVAYSVALSAGSSGTYVQRQLQAGAPSLTYNLFIDSARSAVWGDGSAGTSVASGSATIGPGVGNGRREDSRTIYGRIPAAQDALPGVYSDSIVVTLVF